MNSPAVDFAGILVTAGIGTLAAVSGWAIFISHEPVAPDTCITLYDTGSALSPSPQLHEDYPTVQARIRGAVNGYLATYQKAVDVRDTLHTFRGLIDSTTHYSGVLATTDPTFIGRDDQNRPLITVNFRALRGLATSDLRPL